MGDSFMNGFSVGHLSLLNDTALEYPPHRHAEFGICSNKSHHVEVNEFDCQKRQPMEMNVMNDSHIRHSSAHPSLRLHNAFVMFRRTEKPQS